MFISFFSWSYVTNELYVGGGCGNSEDSVFEMPHDRIRQNNILLRACVCIGYNIINVYLVCVE